MKIFSRYSVEQWFALILLFLIGFVGGFFQNNWFWRF